MALHANIPACPYRNGYLYYSTSALRHFSINSSKELILLEQRTLAQLLRVVLVVVVLLELRITGL